MGEAEGETETEYGVKTADRSTENSEWTFYLENLGCHRERHKMGTTIEKLEGGRKSEK